MSPNTHRLSLFFISSLALLFLAANSVLCKLAFLNNGIDPFSFTSIRLFSGAFTLYLLLKLFSKNEYPRDKGSLLSSAMLFLYAIAFSYAYVLIDTGVGALILFGVVQVVMIAYAIFSKHKVGFFKIAGAMIAFGGLLYLLSPHPDSFISLKGALLMALSGLAWGIYSIVGRNTRNALEKTASNFSRALIFVILFALLTFPSITLSQSGFIYAILSGSVTSGIGYVLWYMTVKKIETSTASIIQLIVPLLATFGGVVLLNETLSWHIILSGVIILSGIALSTVTKRKAF